MKKIDFVIVFLIAASIFINVITLKDGHNWGADFAQYIIHAKNIIAHKPFTADIMLENPFSYPPGFSWLIAPVIKMFGVNFVILKFLNVLFWYLSLLFLYLIFRPRLGSTLALLGSLVLSFSSNFFVYKQNVLSDCPFLFVTTFALYLFLSKCRDEEKLSIGSWPFQVFLLLLIAAYLIRTAGVILFAAAIYYLVFKKKNWLLAGWTFGALVLAVGIHLSVVGFHPNFALTVIQDPASFLALLKARMAVPFQSVFLFYFPELTNLTHYLFLGISRPLAYLSPWIYLVLLGIFIYKTFRGEISLIGTFISLYLFALITWTGFESRPQTLVRVFLPITGLLLMTMLLVLKEKNMQGLANLFLAGVISLNLFNIISNCKFNDDVLYAKENQELFSWVKENIPINEHYVFWEPRTLALMTERVGTSPVTPDPRSRVDFFKRMEDLDIKYFILIKPIDQTLIQALENNSQIFQAKWENSYYKIFRR